MNLGAGSMSGGIDFTTRRNLLQATPALIALAAAPSSVRAQPADAVNQPAATRQGQADLRRQKLIGYMLAHEQFTARSSPISVLPRAGRLRAARDERPFPAVAGQRGHSGEAWVTLGALGAAYEPAWIGTTVTCPTLRYHPAIVAEAFATLAQLYPGGSSSASARARRSTRRRRPATGRNGRNAGSVSPRRSTSSARCGAASGRHRGKYYTGRRQALRPAAAADPAPDRGQRPEIDAACRPARRRSRHRPADLAAVQIRMGGRRAGRPARTPPTCRCWSSNSSSSAIATRRRRRRAVALSAEGVQGLLQHPRPAQIDRARRCRTAARRSLRRLAGRHRPGHPCRSDATALRQRRDHRQHPFGPARPAQGDRVLRPRGAAEIRGASSNSYN